MFSSSEAGFCILHQVADSPPVMLLVILTLMSTTALPEPGEHSDTCIWPRGEPSQSWETSACIPYVL